MDLAEERDTAPVSPRGGKFPARVTLTDIAEEDRMDITALNDAIAQPSPTSVDLNPPPFPVESREDLLDIATAITLCDGEPDNMFAALDAMSDELMTQITMAGEAERRLLIPEVLALHQKIDSREALRQQLIADRTQKRELTGKIDKLESEIRLLELQIRALREDEQMQLLEAELTQADAERDRALELVRSDANARNDARAEQWQKTESQRNTRATELREQLEKAKEVAAERETRANELAARMITRTVAGFLVWLGYASVVATGTVLAMLLGSKPGIPTDGVLTTIQTFLNGVPFAQNALTRFAVLIGLLVLFAGATFGIAWLCDRVLRRFDSDWTAGDGEERPVIQLAPSGINRRSYTRLLAVTPYVFAMGACVAFVGAVPASDANRGVLDSLVPTVANTFIGSAIALLATAAFMLYALHIMEARTKGKPRQSWEVAVLPIALLLAVGLAVMNPMIHAGSNNVVQWRERLAWGGWALFMLVTSLALAYGLIYHGIYKDETKAHERVQRLHWLIEKCEFPPAPVFPSLKKWKTEWLSMTYARERQRQEAILRRFATARALGLKVVEPPLERRWLFWKKSPNGTNGHNGFHVIDLRIAPKQVERIEELRGESRQLLLQVSELDRAIAEKENLCGIVPLEHLRDELATKVGQVQSSEANDVRLQAAARFAKTDLELRIRGAITTARTIGGRIDPTLSSRSSTPSSSPKQVTP